MQAENSAGFAAHQRADSQLRKENGEDVWLASPDGCIIHKRFVSL